MSYMTMTAEQLRIAENLALGYEALLDAQRQRRAMPRHMRWKASGGREYLYETPPAKDSEISRGVRNGDTEAAFAEYVRKREELERRIETSTGSISEVITQYRALGLPTIEALPARILRELDLRGSLGADFFVVGTNAFAAYEMEARERFARELQATEDFDLAWVRGAQASMGSAEPGVGSPLLQALKQVDSTFRMGDRRYKAVNDTPYEVELLAAPSVIRTFQEGETFSPVPLPEQEWLLKGKPVRHIVAARDRSPAPLVVPDPRWMALHKIWLARKATRKATKRDKDARQGDLLLSAVARKMADSHPIDTDFVLELPSELLDIFNEWAAANQFIPGSGAPKRNWF